MSPAVMIWSVKLPPIPLPRLHQELLNFIGNRLSQQPLRSQLSGTFPLHPCQICSIWAYPRLRHLQPGPPPHQRPKWIRSPSILCSCLGTWLAITLVRLFINPSIRVVVKCKKKKTFDPQATTKGGSSSKREDHPPGAIPQQQAGNDMKLGCRI